ncbi:50S ribosomal protein L18e [Candidatus Woesearchaeota archaeon]|nr:50S ribosomal protein L18e [Candidatus Woesearchaeota archaeon]
MKSTGPTNPNLLGLIGELKKQSIEQKISLWKRIAVDLEKPTRNRRIVNLSKIDKCAKENETIIVPGKVLAGGALNQKLTIAAFKFSGAAKEKIQKSGSKIVQLSELLKESPKGKKVRIIG